MVALLGGDSTPAAIRFGEKTLSGAGAASTTLADGSYLSGALTASSGVMTRSATGTLTPGTTTVDGVDIVVEADAYSVSTHAEVVAAAQDSALALGDEILLRTGTYNLDRSGAAINRSTTLPTGTWSGSNYVVIKPHTGETATIARLAFANVTGNRYFSIENVNLDTSFGTADSNSAALDLKGSMRVKNFTAGPSGASTPQAPGVCAAIYAFPGQGNNLIIEDGVIDGCNDGLWIGGTDMTVSNVTVRNSFADSLKLSGDCSGLTVEGFISTDKAHQHSDVSVSAITPGSPTVITLASPITVGSVFFGRVHGLEGTDYAALSEVDTISAVTSETSISLDIDTTGAGAYAGGGTFEYSTFHGDHIQYDGSSASDGAIDDWTLRGILMTRGNSERGWPDGQGLILTNADGFALRNLVAEGLLYAGSQFNGISLVDATSGSEAFVRSVVCVGIPDILTGTAAVPRLQLGAHMTCDHAIATDITFRGGGSQPATTRIRNTEDSLANTQVALEAAFDNPQIDTEETVDALTAYATKAGSAGDLASPKQGVSPYLTLNPASYSNPATVPEAFAVGNWTLTDATSGGTLTIGISTLAGDGYSDLTDLEYRLDGGAAVSLGGTASGNYDITGLTDDTEYDVEIRAVNALGDGAWSDVKAGTPTTAAASFALRDSAATAGNSAALSATLPTYVSGDLLVAIVGVERGNATPTTPSGWTEAEYSANFAGTPPGSPSTHPWAHIYTRVADGTEGSTVTFTRSYSVDIAAHIMSFSGANSTLGAFDSSAVFNATITAPSITASADSLVIAAHLANTAITVSATGGTALESSTDAHMQTRIYGPVAGGATGAITATAGSNSNVGLQIEIQPAP